VTGLRASFEGVPAKTERGIRQGRRAYRVTIDMRGLNRGLYVARVRYRIDPDRSGPRRARNATRVHFYRACTGNPKGGGSEGPNDQGITIL